MNVRCGVAHVPLRRQSVERAADLEVARRALRGISRAQVCPCRRALHGGCGRHAARDWLAAHTPSLLFGQSLLAEHCALSTELLRVCRGTTISHPGVCPPLLILFCRARSFVLWLCFAHAAVSFVPNLDCKLRTERSFWREYFSASLRFGRRTFAALFRWHHKTLTLLLRPGVAQMVSLALHSLVWARLCKWVIHSVRSLHARACCLPGWVRRCRANSACAGGSQPAHGRS